MKTTLLQLQNVKTSAKAMKRTLVKMAALILWAAPLTVIAGGPANINNNNVIGTSSANDAKTATARQTSVILSLRNDPLMQDFLPYNDTNRLSETEVAALQKIDHYLKGQADADDNFRTKKGFRRTVFLTSLVAGPVVGIIPTAIGASKVPSDSTLNMPKTTMAKDDDYVNGYKSEAHYIKKHNTWGRYIVASLIWLAAANLVILH